MKIHFLAIRNLLRESFFFFFFFFFCLLLSLLILCLLVLCLLFFTVPILVCFVFLQVYRIPMQCFSNVLSLERFLVIDIVPKPRFSRYQFPIRTSFPFL